MAGCVFARPFLCLVMMWLVWPGHLSLQVQHVRNVAQPGILVQHACDKTTKTCVRLPCALLHCLVANCCESNHPFSASMLHQNISSIKIYKNISKLKNPSYVGRKVSRNHFTHNFKNQPGCYCAVIDGGWDQRHVKASCFH